MSIWLAFTIAIEFILLILLGLGVGILLNREALIKFNKVDKEPNDKEKDKQQGYGPGPPIPLNDNKHTNTEAYYTTAYKIADALPRLIAHCVYAVRGIIAKKQPNANKTLKSGC